MECYAPDKDKGKALLKNISYKLFAIKIISHKVLTEREHELAHFKFGLISWARILAQNNVSNYIYGFI